MIAALAHEKFDEVVEGLKEVQDPELGVNIVDLGLIYDLAVEKTPAGKNVIEVKMTLTASARSFAAHPRR